MPVKASPAFARQQIAFRRLLLTANGTPSRDGRVIIAAVRRLLGAGPRDHLTKFTAQGAIDPTATVAAAQRREVWDQLVKLINLDAYTVANIEDE